MDWDTKSIHNNNGQMGYALKEKCTHIYKEAHLAYTFKNKGS